MLNNLTNSWVVCRDVVRVWLEWLAQGQTKELLLAIRERIGKMFHVLKMKVHFESMSV